MALAPVSAGADGRPSSAFMMDLLVTGGEPSLIGSIVAPSAERTNATTAVPFVIQGGWVVEYQCDNAANITTTATATTANAPLKEATKSYFIIARPSSAISVSVIPAGAYTVTCRFWRKL